MSDRLINIFFGVALAACIAIGGVSVKKFLDAGEIVSAPDPDYVSAFTGGNIDRDAPVRIVFRTDYDTGSIPSRALRFTPKTRGDLAWEDERTLVFTPAAGWLPDTRYVARVTPAALRRAGADDAKNAAPFEFEFYTRGPAFSVVLEPARLSGDKTAVISGVLVTEPDVGDKDAEKAVSSPDGKIESWEHRGTRHTFYFEPVKRGRSEQTFRVRRDGKTAGSKDKGEDSVAIPPLSVFKVSEITLSENETLRVTFTSPLKDGMEPDGIITMDGADISFDVSDNIVYVRVTRGFRAGAVLNIAKFEDLYGEELEEPVSYTINENWEIPELRFSSKGVILPATQGTVLVIETRNISGVIIEAFEIYGKNITQFLQINRLNESSELTRVGAPLWTRSFEFGWNENDKNIRLRRGLDISDLAQKYPDGMFRIRVTFRKRHVHYECTAEHGDFSKLEFPDDDFPEEYGYGVEFSTKRTVRKVDWDHWEEWRRYRNDPCHPAFYSENFNDGIIIAKNVLVSDLALSVKKTDSGEFLVAAENLRTAEGAGGTEIQLLSYQGNVMANARTDGGGIVRISPRSDSGKPAFVFARGLGSRAFLKLNESLSLATAHFDTGGEKYDDGLKGFIYGDRGVWRPGEDIYLTFLLNDTKATLPKGHPVTFELEDPQGRVTESRLLNENVESFYPVVTKTPESAITGNWTARVKAGGAVFYKTLKIETVMPNRLKINLNLGGETIRQSGKITLGASRLHGAPAAGFEADVSARFADTGTSFPAYSGYSFRDASRSADAARQKVFSGRLDGRGSAEFDLSLSPGVYAPGKLTAYFLTRVFEPSGSFSSEQVSAVFSPYKRYVGLKLPPAEDNILPVDTDNEAKIVLLDEEGLPVRGNFEAETALYKMNWRWWWETENSADADFTRALSRTPVLRGSVKIENGAGTWKFRIRAADRGRYLLVVNDAEGGHAASEVCYVDSPWSRRPADGAQDAAFSLKLSADKPVYNVGETINVNFPSNPGATALVVLEKGGEIIRQDWIHCAQDVTNYTWKTNPGSAPTVYVHVSLFQPHLQTANSLPIRLYGIIPLSINDPATVLRPEIGVSRRWEPGASASFTVREAQGRAMTYTAVIVDEGLLGLTRFATPDPHDAFFRKEASFLKSWDVFNDVIGAYSGRLETLLSVGGGDDGQEADGARLSRFEPVVRYFSPRRLAAGAEETLRFEMPNYIGAVRVMIIAARAQSSAVPAAFGSAEKQVEVKSDLMILATAPRALSPGDEAEVPVSIFCYAPGGKRGVRVSLDATGVISAQGGAIAVQDFDAPGDKTVNFRIKAGALAGAGRFTVTARAPGLNDAFQTVNLAVRSTARPVVTVKTKILGAGESWSESLELPGLAGTNAASVELSRSPSLNLSSRLSELVTYPHGCIEQTTSAVFPQLFLERASELSPARLVESREIIAGGISRIAGFQTADGGFSYWPGEGEAHPWGTSYAGHFLLTARNLGWKIDSGMIERWVAFQRSMSGAYSRGDALGQAYRLYTLALAGRPEQAAMNRLRETAELPGEARWRLAAAYWYSGNRETARLIVAGLSASVSERRELSGNFGSALRDKAMILETMAIMGQTDRTQSLVEDLSRALSGEGRLTTQEAAYALIALLPFISEKPGENIAAELRAGGVSRRISAGGALVREEFDLSGTGKTDFLVKNESGARFYAQITVRGTPAEGSERFAAEGLNLSIRYLKDGVEIKPEDAAPGDDVEVAALLQNTGPVPVENIAVVHVLPASWEIINTRLGGGENSDGKALRYQDIRDDRVNSYLDLAPQGRVSVRFRVNRTYGGEYFIPAVHAYAMYDESVRAVVPARGAGR